MSAHPPATVSTGAFLKDVFTCSLGAYGGPEAHMSVFLDQLVTRRKYLSEAELVELIALCSILPGPTSTQTIVAVGHKMGGPWLALMTMIVWALPALVVMTLLSFLYAFLAMRDISGDLLRYVGPMAVGFILVAVWRIGRKVVTDVPTGAMMVAAGVITYFIRAPWIFPAVLVAGGAASILMAPEKDLWNRVRFSPPWRYLAAFGAFALGALALAAWTDWRLATLFEHFYRYGYLVFGGGQVVVPVMHGELVEGMRAMTSGEFLTGYGLVQGLPGPMFSFAAYAGGMAARDGSVTFQVAGAVVGGVGIFLPGLLLIYFVYPVWESLKGIRAIRVSLRGVNAVAGGLIAVAGVILLQTGGLAWDHLLVTALTAALLFSRKVPAPLIVAAALAAGLA
ncbi:chromate efflux transporter [Myxococcota bacterium]|nr:chromate efflux transporter [Myxococcota bacterium]